MKIRERNYNTNLSHKIKTTASYWHSIHMYTLNSDLGTSSLRWSLVYFQAARHRQSANLAVKQRNTSRPAFILYKKFSDTDLTSYIMQWQFFILNTTPENHVSALTSRPNNAVKCYGVNATLGKSRYEFYTHCFHKHVKPRRLKYKLPLLYYYL